MYLIGSVIHYQTESIMKVRSATPDRYLSTKQVRELTGLGTTWLYLLRKRGEMPQPVRLSNSPSGRLRYRESDILEWMESRRDVVLLDDEKAGVSS